MRSRESACTAGTHSFEGGTAPCTNNHSRMTDKNRRNCETNINKQTTARRVFISQHERRCSHSRRLLTTSKPPPRTPGMHAKVGGGCSQGYTGRSQFTLLHELALAIHREHVISSIVYSLNVISYDKNAPGHMFAIHTVIAKCSNGFTLVEADVCMLVSTLFSNEIVQKPGCNS